MNALSTVLLYELGILLTLLGTLVAYKLLTGRINTRGLLYDKMSERAFSPGRLQLLITTVGGALYYLSLVFANEKPGEFPAVPSELLLALGGSHAFYLGGKFSLLLKQVFGLASPRNK